MTRRQEIENEMVLQKDIMAESDVYAIKSQKMGYNFQEHYPERYAAYVAANARYNELEIELEEEKRKEEEEREESHCYPEE